MWVCSPCPRSRDYVVFCTSNCVKSSCYLLCHGIWAFKGNLGSFILCTTCVKTCVTTYVTTCVTTYVTTCVTTCVTTYVTTYVTTCVATCACGFVTIYYNCDPLAVLMCSIEHITYFTLMLLHRTLLINYHWLCTYNIHTIIT